MAIDAYNYDSFRLKHYGDSFVMFPAPKIGDKAVEFSATTLSGDVVRLSDYAGKTVVLETGSFSCPHVVFRVSPMNTIAQRHPDTIFILLYTREAHPGKEVPPITTFRQKLTHANRLKDEENEGRLVLVDDVEGSAHLAYGGLPDSVFVIDGAGSVVFRSSWNDVDAVNDVLTRMNAGQTLDGVKPHFKLMPLSLAMCVFRRSGWQSLGDFLVSFPAIIWHHIRVPART